MKVAESTTLLRTILNRIKELEALEFDKDVAPLLQTNQAGLEKMKNRDSIPWERLVEYSRHHAVSLEWLVNGHGPARRAHLGVSEPGSIYTVTTDQDVVYKLAADLNAIGAATLGSGKYLALLKLLHREYLDTGKYPPAEKIAQQVDLAR